MPEYIQEFSRADPGCVLFLVDESFSMNEKMRGNGTSKIEKASRIVNKLISEMIQNCEKGDDKPWHYLDIGVIRHTTDANCVSVVGSAFGGALAGQDLVGIPDLFDNPLDVEVRKMKSQQEDGTGNVIAVEEDVYFPIWYRPPRRDQMFGGSMRTACGYALSVLKNWLATHSESFPPVVINITDGDSNDGDPASAMEALQSLATRHGNVLVMNVYCSTTVTESILFPTNESHMPDDFAKRLYRLSSELPDSLRAYAEIKNVAAPIGCRMMAIEADPIVLLRILPFYDTGAMPSVFWNRRAAT